MEPLELGNRRKYPISIRHIHLWATNLNIRFVGRNAADAIWYIDKSGASHFTSHALGPSEHEKVAFHFKQWGGVNKKRTGRTLDGRTWDQLPRRAAAEPAVAFGD